MNKLEIAMVLNVAEHGLVIEDNYEITKDGFPVGTAENSLIWFPQSTKPKPDEIKDIVYLGFQLWGVKQLVNKLDEFNKLSDTSKEEVLDRLIELERTQHNY